MNKKNAELKEYFVNRTEAQIKTGPSSSARQFWFYDTLACFKKKKKKFFNPDSVFRSNIFILRKRKKYARINLFNHKLHGLLLFSEKNL